MLDQQIHIFSQRGRVILLEPQEELDQGAAILEEVKNYASYRIGCNTLAGCEVFKDEMLPQPVADDKGRALVNETRACFARILKTNDTRQAS